MHYYEHLTLVLQALQTRRFRHTCFYYRIHEDFSRKCITRNKVVERQFESSSGNIVMNDLLTYYNDQNGTCISKTKFKELLKSNHYETCNTSGITLVRQCEGYLETNSWKFGENKRRVICVKGVKIKNLDAVSSCQNDQSSSN